MVKLKADIWVDDVPSIDSVGLQNHRGVSRLPVTDIKLWLECFARMVAILVTCFPEKGPSSGPIRLRS